MSWGWFLSFQPTPNSLCCVLNKRTEEKAGAWVCLFVWVCFALFICLNYLLLHLKWPKFARQLQSFHLDAGTVALAQWSCWLWVCPMHSPRGSLGDRVGSGPALPPQRTESERIMQNMGRGRASVGEILRVCYLSELRPLVALIKSDVYWVWNVLIC